MCTFSSSLAHPYTYSNFFFLLVQVMMLDRASRLPSACLLFSARGAHLYRSAAYSSYFLVSRCPKD